MGALVNPSPFTCLATLTSLVVLRKTLASPSRASKGPFFAVLTKGRLAKSGTPTSSFIRPYARAPNKESWPIYSPEYTSMIIPKRHLRLTMSTESSSSDGLFLFDFDGVVCNSCDECTVSAWRTCQILNAIPKEEDASGDHPPKWLFDKMREIRPAIEVGWQIPVLLSVFLEHRTMAVPDLMKNYEKLVANWLHQHNLTGKDMIRTFGQIRDDWIVKDLKSWLNINTFYDGISRGINECRGEAILVTTKQHRFATALVRHAGIDERAMPDDSIYGLGMYKSKSDVIADRMHEGGSKATDTHFFEDRWPTIAKCLKDDRLEGVNFYLCSWGYCTEEELKLAEHEPRVEVLKLEDFAMIVTQ